MQRLNLSFRFLGISLLLALLSACSNTALKQQKEPELAWRAALGNINHWQINAKAGLQHDQTYNTLTLDWVQKLDSYNVQMTGPMGQGHLAMQGDSRSMILLTPEGRYVSNDPEALLQDRTGLSIPVNQLTYWIKGEPAPGKITGSLYDQQGRIAALEQDGWRIEYTDFTQQDTLWLPRKLEARKDKVRLKLVIKQWQILP
ncbi:lipoprotein insertase outer membrane protein LolB [Pokkaliibacter sp. CJK22405]|uniref:lipoprotein insertase outer membrane protein LolB n=1 Tax=Pokkaliibacter sp. CJK22405 TaxID=3384615 RepID=UPI003984EB8A